MQKQFKRFIPQLAKEAIEQLDYKRKDDLYCIVDLIYRKTVNYKTELQKIYGYTQISNQVFKTLISDSNAINNALQTLISEDIIQVNDHYYPGVFCKSYKINSDLLSKKVEVTIQDKNINKRIANLEKERRKWTEKNIEFAKTNYYKSFKIDYEAAYQFIYDEAVSAIKLLVINSDLKITENEIKSIINCSGNFKKYRGIILMYGHKELHNILHRFMSQHFKILSIKNGYLYFKRNATNGRLDTNLTTLPTTLRQFIISDETLYNIDIKNSQPYFLYSLLKTERAISTEELERYGELVLSGTFYEYLAERYSEYTGQLCTREKAKNMLFKIFFSKVESFSKIKEFFATVFPEIMEYINENNAVSNAITANKLSTIESTTIISVILPKLSEKGLKPFTIHDSFVCRESEIQTIKDTINDVTVSMYGMAPNLHCNTLIEDSMKSITEKEIEDEYEEPWTMDDLIAELNNEDF
jgi:hypothetical protein